MNVYGVDISNEAANDMYDGLDKAGNILSLIAESEFTKGDENVGRKYAQLSQLCNFLTDQLKNLEQNTPSWYLASKYAPLDNKYVLGYWLNDDGEYDVDMFKYVNWQYKHFGDTIERKRIIAWMYLPDKFQK